MHTNITITISLCRVYYKRGLLCMHVSDKATLNVKATFTVALLFDCFRHRSRIFFYLRALVTMNWRLQVSFSCDVLCQFVSFRYLARSCLRHLAPLSRCKLGAIQILRNAFFWKLDPHPPLVTLITLNLTPS